MSCALSWELLAVRWLLGLVMATSWGSSTLFVGKNAGHFAAFTLHLLQSSKAKPAWQSLALKIVVKL